MTSYCNYGSEVIGQGEDSQIIVDGRYHETLSSVEEAGAAVIVIRQVPEEQGEGKKMSPPEARLLTTEMQSNDINQRLCSSRSTQDIASTRH